MNMDAITIIKDLVIKESGVDICEKSRRRNVIEVRSLFYVLTKTIKPLLTYSAIGDSVGVSHATVLHSLTMYEVYSKYNKELNRLKEVIINRYKFEHPKFYEIYCVDDEIKNIEKQIAELNELKEFLKNKKNNLVV